MTAIAPSSSNGFFRPRPVIPSAAEILEYSGLQANRPQRQQRQQPPPQRQRQQNWFYDILQGTGKQTVIELARQHDWVAQLVLNTGVSAFQPAGITVKTTVLDILGGSPRFLDNVAVRAESGMQMRVGTSLRLGVDVSNSPKKDEYARNGEPIVDTVTITAGAKTSIAGWRAELAAKAGDPARLKALARSALIAGASVALTRIWRNPATGVETRVDFILVAKAEAASEYLGFDTKREPLSAKAEVELQVRVIRSDFQLVSAKDMAAWVEKGAAWAADTLGGLQLATPSATQPARRAKARLPGRSGSAAIYGPANPQGIGSLRQRVSMQRAAREEQLRHASRHFRPTSLSGAVSMQGGYRSWQEAGEVAGAFNNAGQATSEDMIVRVPMLRDFGSTRRMEPVLMRGSAFDLANEIAAARLAGTVPANFDLHGAAMQSGISNFEQSLRWNVDARAAAVEASSPTTLHGNSTFSLADEASAVRAAARFNGSATGADDIALFVPLRTTVQGHQIAAVGTATVVYVSSPDQLRSFYLTMTRQGRIPKGTAFNELLRKSGIGPSTFHQREAAARDLRAAQAEVASPTMLFASTVGVQPTKAQALSVTLAHNSAHPRLDAQVQLYVPLLWNLNVPGVQATGVAHAIYQNTPDKLRGFFTTMQLQNRIPRGVTFESLLKDSGIDKSYPARLDATRERV